MPFGLEPASLTTELDAINLVLDAQGIEAVDTIDLSDGDVGRAARALNTADLEVQQRGWSFNRDETLTLSPDGDGNIVLPDGTLQVAQAYWNGGIKTLVEREGKLYDNDNQTFTFTADQQVDITIRLPFTDIPQVARTYIAKLAAHRVQGKGVSQSSVTQITQQELMQALAALEQAEDEAKPKNQVSGNLSTLGTLLASGVRRKSNWGLT